MLTQVFPKKVNSEEQREILSLLCKVHQLEMDNMDMQSSCVLRNFEIAKRDMAISVYHNHRDLCHEIIIQQRALMEEQNVTGSKELEDLYEVYQQEYGDLLLPDIHSHKVTFHCQYPELYTYFLGSSQS